MNLCHRPGASVTRDTPSGAFPPSIVQNMDIFTDSLGSKHCLQRLGLVILKKHILIIVYSHHEAIAAMVASGHAILYRKSTLLAIYCPDGIIVGRIEQE